MSSEWRTQLALLPDYLGQHLALSMSALLLGIALSLPLALFIIRRKRLQSIVLGTASAIQTIPSLALLALMVPLLRTIGFMPALIALTLYSMLPVLRNTVTGIENIDPALNEAGRALGMTDAQLLRKVQLPLALPVIVAGVRTAAVWVIGIATLSTPVGATSLGNYIFSGLQTRNTVAVLVGCISAALLALLVDGLIRWLESGLSRRRRLQSVAACVVLLGLLIAGLMPLAKQPAPQDSVIVGAKTFTEQYILAQAISERLEEAGFAVSMRDSLGSTVVFDALRTGQVDAYVEYSGTIWANYMKRADNPGREVINAEVRKWLVNEHNISTVFALGFENAYALAVRRAAAEQMSLRTIEDLLAGADGLTLAADYEFFSRPEWASVQLKYGLDFAQRVSMDPSLMYQALQAGEVDVITAFSTDGRIDAFDLVLLEDTRQAFPPYDAMLLVAPGQGARQQKIGAALSDFAGSINNQQMRAANRRVDLDGESVTVAAELLR